MSEQALEQLLYDIRLRMAAYRTWLSVPQYKQRAIDELEFLIVLLKDIATNNSLETADYIEELIHKAKNGTYKTGD